MHEEFITRLCDIDRLPSLDDKSVLHAFGFSDTELSIDKNLCSPGEFTHITLCTPTWPCLPSPMRVFAHTQPVIQSLRSDEVITHILDDDGPVVQAVTILSRLAGLQIEMELRLRIIVSAGRTILQQYSWRASRLRLFAWSMIVHFERLIAWLNWLNTTPEAELATLDVDRELSDDARAASSHMSRLHIILLLWPLCQHHKQHLATSLKRPSLAFLADEALLQKAEFSVLMAAPLTASMFGLKNIWNITAPQYPATKGLYPIFTKKSKSFALLAKALGSICQNLALWGQ